MKSIFNSSSSSSSSFCFLFFLFSSVFVSWSTLLLSSHHRVVVAFSLLNSEGEALLSLFNNSISFEDSDSVKLVWNNLSSSNISSPCDWEGIGCNTKKTHVISLNLSNYGISGQLGPQIGQLTYLKYLDVSRNDFTGSIPIELWNCSHLQYLDLSFNSFSGKLPELWNCSHLQYLDLSLNNFSGKLPELWNCSHFQYLDLSLNSFSAKLPESLFQISGLKSVDLSANGFTGLIPTELWNCSHLQHLDLSLNNLTGKFPLEAMRNLHQLKTFSIYRNQFSGRIPEYLFQNSGLETVSLGKNKLSGSIPVNIANCTKLEVVVLRENSLSGEIPLGVWRIPTLVEIDVSFNNLSGELPVEMTTGLHHLNRIYLRENQFFGSVPKDLGINNTNLEEVDFSYNVFTGKIPPNLCFGKKLTYMQLNQNQFHGNIPSSYTTQNCDSLRELSLQGNNLTASLPHFGQLLNNNNPSDPQGMMMSLDLSRNNIHGQIPSSICNLTSLRSLDLSENQMNGTLPHCLGNLNQLSELKLRSNNFSGTIPMNFTSYSLYTLDLNGNCLEGKIPISLGINSPFLEYLDLGNNQFNDTFPSFLENSSSLQILVLRSNKLYGPLTHSGYLAAFTKLRILDISSNYLSGNLPPLGLFILGGLDAMKNIDKNEESSSRIDYSPISTLVIHKGKEMELNQTMMNTFRLVDMSNNRFQGRIPESIGKLLLLTSLNLSNNNLNGRIPSSLGNLTRLESLDLSKNKLFGEIPRQLTNLNFLGVLNLSHNNLTGHIPTAGQFQTYPNSSFDGNPGLCGLQSSTGCGNDAGKGSLLHQDPVEDSNSWSFGWEPVVIGYGCGVLIGLVLQYFIFTKASMYRWFG